MGQRDLPGVAWEPTLGIGPDGAAYYTMFVVDPIADAENPQTFTYTPVLRSQDGGATWEDVTPTYAGQPPPAPTADHYLHVDTDTGRVFFDELTLACTYLAFSDDQGASWQLNPAACGTARNDHQTLFTGPAPENVETVGYPNLVYLCAADLGLPGSAHCSTSLDGGRTFGPAVPVYVNDPEGSCASTHGHGTVGPEGTAYLPTIRCGTVEVHTSRDGGLTWTRHVVDDTVGASDHGADTHEARVAVDASGTIYAYWIGGDELPYMAYSHDRGASWTDPVMVGGPGVVEASFPAITAGDAGRVAFLYYGTRETLEVNESRATHAYVGYGLDIDSGNATFATVRVSDDPVARGPCGDRCGGVGDFLDLTHDPTTGEVWAALVDICRPEDCPEDTRDSGPSAIAGPFRGRAAVGIQVGGTSLIQSASTDPATADRTTLPVEP